MKNFVLVFVYFVLGFQLVFADTPIDVEITVDGDDIDLSWDDPAESEMFYIYRSTEPNSGFVKIDSSLTTEYTDIGSGTGTKYFYFVTAEEIPSIVTDIDGNDYQTIQIGNQLWMAENLKVTRYKNGDPIPHITTDNTLWTTTTEGAYCMYGNVLINENTYGKLYNWKAVVDPRGLAPEGWHVPTDQEFIELEVAMGMSAMVAGNYQSFRGAPIGSVMAGRADLWVDGGLDNHPEFGTSGFNLLPGGCRHCYNGGYQLMAEYGYLWSSSSYDSNDAMDRRLTYNGTGVGRFYVNKRMGYSVRCVMD